MIVAYVDESGNDGTSLAFAMATILLSHSSSYYLGNDWGLLLKGFGFREFHATHFHGGRDELRGDEKRRRAFSNSAVELLNGWEVKHSAVFVEGRRASGEGVLADEIIFLTNRLELPAATVAAVFYKERWQVELLFKALKQNLRVKTFVGTTANALKTQIWAALIALLAVKFLQLQSKFSWSLSRLIALLRQQLFVYRDLWRWLESPFEPPMPLTEEDLPQLSLAWIP